MGEKGLVKKYRMAKYQGKAVIIQSELNRRFKATDFVFVCDMTDLFGDWVPKECIIETLDFIKKSKARFLLLTKNPRRYLDFEMPPNVTLGCTVESNRSYPLVCKAPLQSERLEAMREVQRKFMNPIFISIEPIMDFNLHYFLENIERLSPWGVAVGYDNYGWKLDEPTLEKTEMLIRELQGFTRVYRKSIRKAWWEE